MDAYTLRETVHCLLGVFVGRVDPETARLEGIAIPALDGEVGMVPFGSTLLRDVAMETPVFLAWRGHVDVRDAEGILATAGNADVGRSTIVARLNRAHGDVFIFTVADLARAGTALEAYAFSILVKQRDAWRITAGAGFAVTGQILEALSTPGNISDAIGIMVKPVKRKAIALPAMAAVSINVRIV